ncbi:MAG: hypothetical protein K2X03_05290 [Bryobacteraceae bacterium]|nr:hypothetical protein [Bryobacteraceae bacterium]
MRSTLLFLCALPLLGQTCTQTLSPNSRSVAAVNGQLFQGNFTVTSNLSTCNWTSTSTVPWIDVQVGQTGRGNGIVGYSVDNNLTAIARTGTILVGNAVFTVSQAASTCSATVTLQGAANIGPEGGGRLLQVATSCEWTAVTNVDWITVGPPTGQRGNGSVPLTILPNNTTAVRTGAVAALGQSVTITQAAGTCSFTLTPTQQSVPAAGGAYSAGLATVCAWSAISNANWVTVNLPNSGTGAASINYSVAANTNSADSRSAVISVGTSNLTIQQAGGNCNVQLSSTAAPALAAGGTGSFSVSTPCVFTARSNVPWITATATANSVTYVVATNPSAAVRTGTITVAGATFTITQAGSTCNFAITPESLDIPAAGVTNGVIQVTTAAGCAWTASSDSPWIRITGQITGSAQGSVQYAVDPNGAGAARSGTLTVAGRAITVRQNSGTAPRFAAGGVVNSASYLAGGVSPGAIVTIFGEDLGPATLTTATLEEDGLTVSKSLAGTRILFDGVPAPMVYTSRGQVSTIVPYSVAGKSSVPVIAEYLGSRSAPATLRILSATPALYSLAASGSGPGAFLNQNGSVNSAATPAAPGEVVILYGTGEGLTTPLQPDGQLTPGVEPLPRPRLPVTVTIGGVNCPILYAGAPPGLVAGALQVNVLLPANVPVGEAVPVVLGVGEALSPDTVTIAIRR